MRLLPGLRRLPGNSRAKAIVNRGLTARRIVGVERVLRTVPFTLSANVAVVLIVVIVNYVLNCYALLFSHFLSLALLWVSCAVAA